MPKILDLFCGAGGASMGYHRAGFEVVGIDINPQPHYPFDFIQRDALEIIDLVKHGEDWLKGIDAIHASPPCQLFTVYRNLKKNQNDNHVNLIPQTRRALHATRLPYVIENTPKAPLIDPLTLCGTSFNLEVRRHRIFESDFYIEPMPCAHDRFTERKYPGSTNRPNGRTVCQIGEWKVPLAIQQKAIGINWMNMKELSQAIPPAYTEYIGKYLMEIIC